LVFSSATEYAIWGLSELTARQPQGNILLEDVVRGTDLPRDFLAKIFQILVRRGILESAKGRGGGFRLAREPHQITLLEVVTAIEGPDRLDRCVIGLDKCNDQLACSQHDLFKPIRQRLKDYLRTTTLADLAASLRSKPTWKGK
jgi:Rrf2 family protein